MRWIISVLAVLALVPAVPQGNADDTAAIRRAAGDYINGFYAGDTARVRQALYPEVVKRQASGASGALELQGVADLVDITTRMVGRGQGFVLPADSIKVLDQYRDMALVRIGALQWVDYLQLARIGSEWRIVNVLWELRG